MGLAARVYGFFSHPNHNGPAVPRVITEMPTQDAEKELFSNAQAVRAVRAMLLREHGPGPFFVLARDRAVIDVYPTSNSALEAGNALFADGRYTVHEVTTTPKRIGAFGFAPL